MATVLLAWDGSDFAAAAMSRAVTLLGHDHHYVALAVVAPTNVPASTLAPIDAMDASLPDTELEVQIEATGEAACESELAALVADLDVAAEQRVMVGDPGSTICRVAEQTDADLIVIGARNRGVLKRVLFGSTSNHVVRHAPCPVLLVDPERSSAGT